MGPHSPAQVSFAFESPQSDRSNRSNRSQFGQLFQTDRAHSNKYALAQPPRATEQPMMGFAVDMRHVQGESQSSCAGAGRLGPQDHGRAPSRAPQTVEFCDADWWVPGPDWPGDTHGCPLLSRLGGLIKGAEKNTK